MHVILMGAQGSGKGTQAAQLGPEFHLERIATGDLFRAEIASRSPLGIELKGILDSGNLVPDDLTNELVRGRIADLIGRRETGEPISGGLFDGFPRTAAQAEALDDILAEHGERVNAVVEIDVPRDVLIARMSGRRVCTNCGAVYQIDSNPPAVDGVCDTCGGIVIQRDDDTPESIARRLELFDKMTSPLLEYYRAKGNLVTVDGNRPVKAVYIDIRAAVSAQDEPEGTA